MATTKITLKGAGVQALLKAPGVQADLARRGHAIAAAAGPGVEVHPHVGKNRARVSVVTMTPEAMEAEARDRRLSRSIDAGRR